MGRFLYGPVLMLAVGVFEPALAQQTALAAQQTALAEPVARQTALAEPVARPVAPGRETPELIAPGVPSATPDAESADDGMLLDEDAAPNAPVPLAFAPATDYSAEQNPIRPLDGFWGYRTVEHAASWMVGDGNR